MYSTVYFPIYKLYDMHWRFGDFPLAGINNLLSNCHRLAALPLHKEEGSVWHHYSSNSIG